MSPFKLVPVDRPDVPPLPLSPRLKSQLVYFRAMDDAPGVPALGENEYWFDQDDVGKWLSEGVFHLVSPLDTENMTEVELSEEQEVFLGWLEKHGVRHVRVEE